MDDTSWRPSNDTLVAVDAFGHLRHLDSAPHLGVLVPYVVSQPAWLVGQQAAAVAPEWHRRKLLFFAGHVPKLYLSDTRYLLWDAYRKQEEQVTILSPTIGCTVGQFSECRRGRAFFAAQPDSYFWNYCAPFCNRSWHSPDAKKACGGGDVRATRAENEFRMRKACSRYAGVNYSSELWADIDRTHRRLSHAEYLSAAMRHRFCLIAPGDTPSTHKVAEAIALGAAGGCLPVLVLRGKSIRKSARATLPYTRWLNYCRIAFIVREADARSSPLRLLRWLGAVTDKAAMAKRQALLSVRNAFVFRGDSLQPVEQDAATDAAFPRVGACGGAAGQRSSGRCVEDAADFILGEACHAARGARRTRMTSTMSRALALVGVNSRSVDPVIGGEHSQCTWQRWRGG